MFQDWVFRRNDEIEMPWVFEQSSTSFGSNHAGGVSNFLFLEGHVVTVPYDADRLVMMAQASISGGEVDQFRRP
ncbi:hypothetical protein COU78_01225 [Candidatus Peregrinibacteria bacterium CG10_big_fil_rev_8_21_14_0_10_49_24]|nr:MAG: hypothetical protein COU78_01225 [Candidatus Peregrinibacteria bacterium CG10_big_fil_rev_8_21_14_0_10_49_24]PJA68112.1 MAG: hypothetical protein CO157_01040 [Candidatus Peregrinibacteria bacterium CG_4_9_14_3_um_filter_49_12]